MSLIADIEKLLLAGREAAASEYARSPSEGAIERLQRAVAANQAFAQMRHDDVLYALQEEIDPAAAVLRVARRFEIELSGFPACSHGHSGVRCDDCYAAIASHRPKGVA